MAPLRKSIGVWLLVAFLAVYVVGTVAVVDAGEARSRADGAPMKWKSDGPEEIAAMVDKHARSLKQTGVEEDEEGVEEVVEMEQNERMSPKPMMASDYPPPFIAGEPRVVVDTEGGSVKTWSVSGPKDTLAVPYGLGLITLKPRAMNVPMYANADMVFYVLQGTGRLEFHHGATHYKRTLERGDVYGVPAGQFFFFLNTAKTDSFKILGMSTVVGDISTENYEVFYVGGGKFPPTVLGGFDRDILRKSLNFSEDEVDAILSSQREGGIVFFPDGLPPDGSDIFSTPLKKEMEVEHQSAGKPSRTAAAGLSTEAGGINLLLTDLNSVSDVGEVWFDWLIRPFLRLFERCCGGGIGGNGRRVTAAGRRGGGGGDERGDQHYPASDRGSVQSEKKRQQEKLLNGMGEASFFGMDLEGPYNVERSTPDFSNVDGWFSAVDQSKLGLLKHVGMGVFRVKLHRGSMMLPHWNPDATEMGMVTAGHGLVEMTFPNGTLAMKEHLKAGDVFLIPQFHAIMQVAAQNEPFQFITFTTTSHLIHHYFLVGQSSVLHEIAPELLASAFGISKGIAEKVKDAQQGSAIIGPLGP